MFTGWPRRWALFGRFLLKQIFSFHATPSPLNSPLSPVLSAALWVRSLGEKGRFGSCEVAQTSRWDASLRSFVAIVQKCSDGPFNSTGVYTCFPKTSSKPQQAALPACRRGADASSRQEHSDFQQAPDEQQSKCRAEKESSSSKQGGSFPCL